MSGEAQDEAPRKLGINFPPVKSQEEIDAERKQRAGFAPEEVRQNIQEEIPPVIRSVLELSHMMMAGHSQWLRASPGYQGGLFYKGKPYCFSSGYRDGKRPLDPEDKGNHLKLKDPLVYGHLSLPILAAYVCELHGKGLFNLETPLAEYLPELQSKCGPEVTARSILSFRTVLHEPAILRDAGARPWKAYVAFNRCQAMQDHVYEPINRFLAGNSGKALKGREQRENFVHYLSSSSSRVRMLTRSLPRAGISHFSVALLVAAVERQLKTQSWEESIRVNFFERAQCHGSSYGPPKLFRDPNEMFYQPSGLGLLHQGFKHPVPSASVLNCAPPLFNASMNLHAPAEDYGKLLLLSIDAINDAREILGELDCQKPHYDLGVRHVPADGRVLLRQSAMGGLDVLPSTASFRYSSEYDLGCFGVANCGTRGARLFSDMISQVIQHLFVKHVLRAGVKPDEQVNLDDPVGAEGNESEAEKKLKRAAEKQKYTNYFKDYNAHTRH